MNALNSCLSFLELFINENQKPKKTFGLVKLIPSLENLYGINEEIDVRVDNLLQILEK